MNTRLLGVLVLMCGIGLFAWSLSARNGSQPSLQFAAPSESTPGAEPGGEPMEVRAPVPQEEPDATPSAPLDPPAEPVEAAPAELVELPLLQQTEASWAVEFAQASREDLDRAHEVLAERFAEEGKVAFKLRLAEGQFETVSADAEPVSDPEDPDGLIVFERDVGDGTSQRVVLYPHDVPELYVLRSKTQWLERRIAELGDG